MSVFLRRTPSPIHYSPHTWLNDEKKGIFESKMSFCWIMTTDSPNLSTSLLGALRDITLIMGMLLDKFFIIYLPIGAYVFLISYSFYAYTIVWLLIYSHLKRKLILLWKISLTTTLYLHFGVLKDNSGISSNGTVTTTSKPPRSIVLYWGCSLVVVQNKSVAKGTFLQQSVLCFILFFKIGEITRTYYNVKDTNLMPKKMAV